jgi:hypothetical protein
MRCRPNPRCSGSQTMLPGSRRCSSKAVAVLPPPNGPLTHTSTATTVPENAAGRTLTDAALGHLAALGAREQQLPGTFVYMAWSWRRRRRHPRPRRPWRRWRRHQIRLGRPVAPLTELGRVPSPGGWTVPPGVRPGWNWTPLEGIVPRPDRAPRWVRWWHATPFIDQYASAWMWRHGAADVFPPPAREPGGGDSVGVREPRRPVTPSGTGSASLPSDGEPTAGVGGA